MEYTIVPLAHVAVTGSDYNIYISMCTTTHQMHIFKYNDQSCEYEIFDREGEACEFIARPLARNSSKKR